ncbi:hypothetical protein [Paenibacillus sp.]|nr:hypothetical protein [Paenibacillus sp.]HZG58539.1 hypothetical protein [Paenibacillus sp.]
MFIYGKDIPLEDAFLEGGAEAGPAGPVQPLEYVFEYGKDIFPEPSEE